MDAFDGGRCYGLNRGSKLAFPEAAAIAIQTRIRLKGEEEYSGKNDDVVIHKEVS